MELAAQGAPVVIVNPSAPVGPRDVKPTPTGQVIVDFLNRRMPAFLDTGLNWVHVRDVATGHILAAEKGRIGERYILGNTEGNWSMKEMFDVLWGRSRACPRRNGRFHTASRWLAARVRPRRNRNSPGSRPRRPLAGCEWPVTKCFSIRPKRFANWACPRRRPKQALADAVEVVPREWVCEGVLMTSKKAEIGCIS